LALGFERNRRDFYLGLDRGSEGRAATRKRGVSKRKFSSDRRFFITPLRESGGARLSSAAAEIVAVVGFARHLLAPLPFLLQ